MTVQPCDCVALRSALLKAQAALNPWSVFLRKVRPKQERYLESVREEIREALRDR
jgi:hypothetical protein